MPRFVVLGLPVANDGVVAWKTPNVPLCLLVGGAAEMSSAPAVLADATDATLSRVVAGGGAGLGGFLDPRPGSLDPILHILRNPAE